MAKSITIELINEKALKLLREMEASKLIRLKKHKSKSTRVDWSKFKGAMSKQPISEVDKQLKELRSAWE
jgi:hypothetical protein